MKTRKNANHKGIVLYVAVIVMVVLFILLSAVMFFVLETQRTTSAKFRQQQAYLTASTTLESFVAQIQNDTAPTTDAAKKAAQKTAIQNLKRLASASVDGTTTNVSYNGKTDNTDNMGTTTINVKTEAGSTENIVVTCTTAYLGEEETVCAHISTKTTVKTNNFTNAIELLGTDEASYDNLNVIGDMAGLNNTTGKTYTFTNDSSVYGNYFMYGSIQNTTNTLLYLKPSLINEKTGTSVTISEDLIATANVFTIDTSMVRQTGYNYVNVGRDVIVPGSGKLHVGSYSSPTTFEVDIYCSGAAIEGEFEQYGNMYVYKNGETGGNASFGSGAYRPVINGDLLVEGDLTVNGNGLTVNGNIYVTGSISGQSKIGCTGTVQSGVVLAKSGRDAKPLIPAKADEYVYYPEDFFVSNNSDINDISSQYKAFYPQGGAEPANTVTFSSIVGGLTEDEKNNGVTVTDSSTGTSSKFCFEINESCTLDSGFTGGDNFNKFGNGTKVLINVTDSSKDIVIRLQNGLSMGSSWAPSFIVNNTSSLKDGCHQYNCYFVSDSGNSISIGSVGADGKSTHSGSNACNYYFEHMTVLDYQTYIRMYDSSYLMAKTCDLSSVPYRSDFILNPTSVEVTGAYKPEKSSILFLLGENTIFRNSNNSFFQANFFAPQATVDIATSGHTLQVTDSAGTSQTVGSCNVGMIIADKFGSENKAYYVYLPVSENSLLMKSKGTGDETAFGYILNRYDRY